MSTGISVQGSEMIHSRPNAVSKTFNLLTKELPSETIRKISKEESRREKKN
jgi:hypothetical protein